MGEESVYGSLQELVDGERKKAAGEERVRALNLLLGLRKQYHEPIDEAGLSEEAVEEGLKAAQQVDGINWDVVRAAIASSVLEHAIAAVHNE